jgi:hypothetical protein
MLHDTAGGAVVVASILFVLVLAQRQLGWATTWPARLRLLVWPLLDRRFGDRRPFVRDKTDSREYVCSVTCSRRELQKALHDYGYRWNLLSTLKFFLLPSGNASWEAGSWAYRPKLRSTWMFHTYFFAVEGSIYSFHLHQHTEKNYLKDPSGHTDDPRQRSKTHLIHALNNANIEYETRIGSTPQGISAVENSQDR